MPSSEKTPGLSLNKWLGSDIPQREDFVADNLILDAAITALQEGGGSGGSGNDPRLDSHLADTQAHMSATERTLLENAAPVTGTYTGDGQLFQTVVVGFRPRFGFVFAIGSPPLELSATGTAQTARMGIVTNAGDSFGIESVSTGFKAYHLAGSSTGVTYQGLNSSGQRYAYALWK